MLLAAAVWTAEEPEIPRVNGDYLNKVELTRESPHMPFARPLAGGAVRDVSNNNLATYTHEGGSLFYDLISMERTNSYYYLFDGLGSVTELVDSDEDTQNSYRYEAFGRIMSQTQNVPNRYKFVGAYDVYYDATPALYFMQARYYDPWRGGRFISRDPMRGAPQDPRAHQEVQMVYTP